MSAISRGIALSCSTMKDASYAALDARMLLISLMALTFPMLVTSSSAILMAINSMLLFFRVMVYLSLNSSAHM